MLLLFTNSMFLVKLPGATFHPETSRWNFFHLQNKGNDLLDIGKYFKPRKDQLILASFHEYKTGFPNQRN